MGLRLVFSVKLYFINRGLLTLAHRMTVEALGRTGAQERNLSRCRALYNAGQLDFFMGRYDDAQGYLEEGLSVAREIGDKGRIATVLQALGMVCLGQGSLGSARRYFEEGLNLTRDLGNKREFAAAMNALAQLHRMEGNLDAAEPLYMTFLVLARELGDRELVAIGLLNLAMVAIGRGFADDAQKMLCEVLVVEEEIGSMPAGQSILEVSAGLAALREEWSGTALFFGAAEAQTVRTGLRRDPADEAFLAPLIVQARNALGALDFATSEAAGRELSFEESMTKARAWLEANR